MPNSPVCIYLGRNFHVWACPMDSECCDVLSASPFVTVVAAVFSLVPEEASIPPAHVSSLISEKAR